MIFSHNIYIYFAVTYKKKKTNKIFPFINKPIIEQIKFCTNAMNVIVFSEIIFYRTGVL